MQPRPALILTLLAIACSGCACLPSAPNAASARAGKLASERHGDAIVIDWREGEVQFVTLDGNRALAFVNGQPGKGYALAITQDATGSRIVTWPANVRWPGGTAPTLTTTAGKTDYVSFIYNGARAAYDGLAITQNF